MSFTDSNDRPLEGWEAGEMAHEESMATHLKMLEAIDAATCGDMTAAGLALFEVDPVKSKSWRHEIAMPDEDEIIAKVLDHWSTALGLAQEAPPMTDEHPTIGVEVHSEREDKVILRVVHPDDSEQKWDIRTTKGGGLQISTDGQIALLPGATNSATLWLCP